MIILSKANLVDEGIDLDEIKNLIGENSIVVGEDNGNEFLKLLENLQKNHDEIQKVYTLDFFFFIIIYFIETSNHPPQYLQNHH